MSDSITLSNAPQVSFDTGKGSPYPGAPIDEYQYDYVVAGTGSDTVKTDFGDVTVVGSSGTLTFINTATEGNIFGNGTDTVSGGSGTLIEYSAFGGGVFTGGAAGGNIFVSGVAFGNTIQ